MALHVALVIAGLVVLAKGADVFVLGAARLAVALRVSPVVIGAVVLGFGTGLPELLVSSLAAAGGSLDIAAGNIVGSNLANLTLVLGVGGMIAGPETVPRIIRREAPVSLATVALFAVLLQNGLSRWEGAVLVIALVVAVVLILRYTEPEDAKVFAEEAAAEVPDIPAGLRGDVVRVVLGLLATVAGAQLLVVGAQRIATELGLSGGLVGLTLVAIGTSLPELVTAIQAARRNETALVAGNVLGSNMFNSTGVAGTAAVIGPGALTDAGLTVVAAASMVAIAALVWLFLGLAGRLRRSESAILLGAYVATLLLVQ